MRILSEEAGRWGIPLSPEQVAAFQVYYQELLAWNEPAGLTSITDPEGVQIQHFLDSLSCLLVLDPWPGAKTRSIDIGSGAGFPGLPVKILRPQMPITLLEATRKKVRFLGHLVANLGLTGVEVVDSRAEELGQKSGYREAYSLALARAVAPLPVLLEYALPFLEIGGMLVAQRGHEAGSEVEFAKRALEILGGRVREMREVTLPTMREPRYLVVVEKVSPTPGQYPRRPGLPARRPLV